MDHKSKNILLEGLTVFISVVIFLSYWILISIISDSNSNFNSPNFFVSNSFQAGSAFSVLWVFVGFGVYKFVNFWYRNYPPNEEDFSHHSIKVLNFKNFLKNIGIEIGCAYFMILYIYCIVSFQRISSYWDGFTLGIYFMISWILWVHIIKKYRKDYTKHWEQYNKEIENSKRKYRNFQDVIINSDDQVLVREVLQKYVSFDSKIMVTAEFNRQMEERAKIRKSSQ
jgi:hypothetical protein